MAGEFGDLWIFLVGPCVGGALGGLLLTFLRQPRPAETAREYESDPRRDSQAHAVR